MHTTAVTLLRKMLKVCKSHVQDQAKCVYFHFVNKGSTTAKVRQILLSSGAISTQQKSKPVSSPLPPQPPPTSTDTLGMFEVLLLS